MSKLLIKQRVFSWSDTYDVYDKDGNPKYYVEAEFLSIGHKLHIYCHDTGEEVAFIRQCLFRFLPTAEISVGHRVLGEIRKEFTFFVPKYSIDYNGWTIDGDFMGWDYSISNSKYQTVAAISKELFRWGDTYVLTTYDDADEIDALVTVIAIDMMNCSHDD